MQSSKARNATYYTLTGAVIYRIGYNWQKQSNSEKYRGAAVHTKLNFNKQQIVREMANSVLGHISQSLTRKTYEVMLFAVFNICKASMFSLNHGTSYAAHLKTFRGEKEEW